MPRTRNWDSEKPVWNKSSDDWERSCKDAYLIGIRAAKKYIYLENQWVADEDIWHELAVAAKRNNKNPDFRIILMVPHEGLFAAGLGSNQELWIGDEMEAVIDASHSKATFGMYSLVQLDRKNKVQGQIYIHSKILLVDDEWALIGSANAGGISLEGIRGGRDEPDTELSAIILDKKFVTNFRKTLWKEHLGLQVSENYEVRDADRFRGLAGKTSHRMRFFPGYDKIKGGVPTWWRGMPLDLRTVPMDIWEKQSRIVPSLPEEVTSSGIPPTLINAAFRALVVPNPPAGYRCWYRWNCELLRPDPSYPGGRRPTISLKMRSLRYDRDEVWDYSDQDTVYIGKLTAERIDKEVETGTFGRIGCRIKILPLDYGPHVDSPSLYLQYECMFVNAEFAKHNHPYFVR